MKADNMLPFKHQVKECATLLETPITTPLMVGCTHLWAPALTHLWRYGMSLKCIDRFPF